MSRMYYFGGVKERKGYLSR